jgi:predicted HicB family RNase H-like nuclease
MAKGGDSVVSEKKRASIDAWDQKNMVYQTIKVRRESLERFKEACKARGERVNTVFKEFIESYPNALTLELEEEARQAAEANGEELNDWLERAIRDAAQQDRIMRAL